jgi:hypothetical protein
MMMRSGKRDKLIVFIPTVLLLFIACSTKSPEAKAPDTPDIGNRILRANEGHKPLPIDPAVVRADVERHQSWGRLRKAACPRRILDRSEERPPFPAINLLEGLKYATITNDTSRGKYEQVIELTDLGRRTLAGFIEEEMERYIITLAKREYLPGMEHYEKAPKRDDAMIVSFEWRWKPLNTLGERFNLWAPLRDRNEHSGRATYVRTADGWKLEDVWLMWDHRDYVWGVYK